MPLVLKAFYSIVVVTYLKGIACAKCNGTSRLYHSRIYDIWKLRGHLAIYTHAGRTLEFPRIFPAMRRTTSISISRCRMFESAQSGYVIDSLWFNIGVDCARKILLPACTGSCYFESTNMYMLKHYKSSKPMILLEYLKSTVYHMLYGTR